MYLGVDGQVGGDLRVDSGLHGVELLGGERLAVRKVEAELVSVAERATLERIRRRRFRLFELTRNRHNSSPFEPLI